MVQIISPSPRAMQMGEIGESLGTGLAKRLGLAEAETAFQKAQGDPVKLATAMGRLLSMSPDLARAAGPMYEAILNQMRAQELKAGTGGALPSGQTSPFIPLEQEVQPGQIENVPSVTEFEPQEATRKPYIPREYGQIVQDAAKKYPVLFARDPEKAIVQENAAEQQHIARNTALEAQRIKQEDIEKTLKAKLEAETKRLGIAPGTGIAGNLFSKIENDALQSLKPKSEGGRGLTEQQAAKEYGKQIESAGRDYNLIRSWGGTYTMGPWNAKNVQNQLGAVRERFKERKDLENFADLLVAENGMSPMVSRYLTYDVKDVPGLSQEIKKIPKLSPRQKVSGINRAQETLKIAPNLAKAMGKEGSPLAVAQYLSNQGYDVNSWLEYLNSNRKSLDLTERQGRELGLSRSTIPNLTDIWMMIVDDKAKNLGD